MLTNKKNVFWQAFLVAVLIFSLGLVFGVYMEQMRNDQLSIELYESDTSLYDSYALSSLIKSDSISCEELSEVSIQFADRIYEEAKILDRYENSNKITGTAVLIHRKYDLLRTIYWINVIELKKKCGDINTIVYLYNYDSDDVNINAEQLTWSRLLSDLKQEKGNEIILVPIAANQNILSLQALMSEYGVNELPAVIVNEEVVFYEPLSLIELKEYLN
jgi:hypothetical protein